MERELHEKSKTEDYLTKIYTRSVFQDFTAPAND
jgi:hypothetical protein